MSKAFERFINQYNSKGREKGDGYDSSHFVGLMNDELVIVEDMLIADANKMDTTAIQGLSILKSQRAESALRLLLPKVFVPSEMHLRIVQALFEVTHDLTFQKLMLDDFSESNDALRLQAAIALKYTTPNLLTLDVFLRILRTEYKSRELRITATSGILLYYGLLDKPWDMVNFQKYLPLVRMINRSTDEKSLAAAIAEVEKEAAKVKKA